jgi:hypothetical protein
MALRFAKANAIFCFQCTFVEELSTITGLRSFCQKLCLTLFRRMPKTENANRPTVHHYEYLFRSHWAWECQYFDGYHEKRLTLLVRELCHQVHLADHHLRLRS